MMEILGETYLIPQIVLAIAALISGFRSGSKTHKKNK